MKEVTLEELRSWPEESYVLIDIRDEGLVSYGMMPGALHIPKEELEKEEPTALAAVGEGKKLVFYCQIGRKSRELDEIDSLSGREIFSLSGGYIAYVRAGLSDGAPDEKREKAEASIQKKFHKQLFTPFAKACKTYRLIEEGDRIAVDIPNCKIELKVPDEVLAERRANWVCPEPKVKTGYLARYAKLVTSADKGAILQ